MRDAMRPGRDPETANAFRRQIDDLFAPRDPTREYGAILPISSDPNVPGSGQFDPKGGFIGELLGLLGAGGRAVRGEAYDPMAITSGLMNAAAPSVAARPGAGVLRSAGSGGPPRLPAVMQTPRGQNLTRDGTGQTNRVGFVDREAAEDAFHTALINAQGQPGAVGVRHRAATQKMEAVQNDIMKFYDNIENRPTGRKMSRADHVIKRRLFAEETAARAELDAAAKDLREKGPGSALHEKFMPD